MLVSYLNVIAVTTINIEKKWSMQCEKYYTLSITVRGCLLDYVKIFLVGKIM